MTKLEVKYRLWYKGIPPKPIKLQIPGWAGENNDHSDGAKPQPWMCPPFVDGSTYGLELIYPFETECRITRKNNEVIFNGDFSKESVWDDSRQAIPPGSPPFLSFAPDHYGMTSSLDIMPPENYCFRIEPHPRFYTDQTGECPIAVAGNIQRWWGRIFFVAFKSPREGETHIFRKDEPYAHVLIIPNKPTYDIKPMTLEECRKRERQEKILSDYGQKIADHNWIDYSGKPFNNKYKVLQRAFAKGGQAKVDEIIEDAANNIKPVGPKTIKKIPGRLILRETLSNPKKEHKNSSLYTRGKRTEKHIKSSETNPAKIDAVESPPNPDG